MREKPYSKGRFSYSFSVVVVFALALLLRLFLMNSEGCVGDTTCFATWYRALQDHGFSDLYRNTWVDYPPGIFYLYAALSYPISVLTGRFGLNTAVKLPGILFDLLLGGIFLWEARKELPRRSALLISALFLFDPLMIYNSAIWGQVDSVLCVFLLLCLIALKEERYEVAAAWFAVSLLIKPQAIIIGPVILYVFIDQVIRNPKRYILRLVYCVLIFAGIFLLLFLPFMDGQDPLWIPSLYFSTMGGYRYASLEAYNLWYALGIHWVEDTLRLGPLTCFQWGVLLVSLGVILCGVIYGKTSLRRERVLLSAAVFATLFFMLCSRMHERYLYPAAILWCFAALYTKRKGAIFWSGFFSLHSLLNLYASLHWQGRLFALRRFLGACGVAGTVAMLVWVCLTLRGQRDLSRETVSDASS